MKYLIQITKQNRADDIVQEFDTELEAIVTIAQNVTENDGYRIIPYIKSEGEINEDETAIIHERKENSYAEKEIEDIASEIENLHESDGYKVIGRENPVGSKPSRVVKEKPALWITEDEAVQGKKNNWGRTDKDRI